jgi:hypothetical protein
MIQGTMPLRGLYYILSNTKVGRESVTKRASLIVPKPRNDTWWISNLAKASRGLAE